MSHCTHCGAVAAEDASFCGDCGHSLPNASTESVRTIPVGNALTNTTESSTRDHRRRRRWFWGVGATLAVVVAAGGIAFGVPQIRHRLFTSSKPQSSATSISDTSARSGNRTTDVTSPNTANGYNDGHAWGIAECVAQEKFYGQSLTRSCTGVNMAPASSSAQECGATSDQILYLNGVPSDDNVQRWEAGCEAALADAVFIGQSTSSRTTTPTVPPSSTTSSSGPQQQGSSTPAQTTTTSTALRAAPAPPTTTTMALAPDQQKFVDDVENQFPAIAQSIDTYGNISGAFTTQSLVTYGDDLCARVPLILNSPGYVSGVYDFLLDGMVDSPLPSVPTTSDGIVLNFAIEDLCPTYASYIP